MTAHARRLRKAVLPVAGLGTRVLPGTKTTPKELLNVVDRPILSYIVEEARGRFSIIDALVIHRVGELRPTDQIVLVAVTSAHRGDAFDACRFIMDILKTRAPFWKKEATPAGSRWVDARVSDEAAELRWAARAASGKPD